MTRDDVANLVVRTVALWLVATGLTGFGALPWLPEMPQFGQVGSLAIASVPIVIGVVIWLSAAPLARAVFARPDREIPFGITTRGVPALASFVAGLFLLAEAVPEAASWVAVRVALRQVDAGVMGASSWESTAYAASAGLGAQIVARLIAGGVLLALSRRPDFWPIPDEDADEDPSVDPDAHPPASDV